MKPLSFAAAMCLFSSLLAAQTTTSFHSTGNSAFAVAQVASTGFQVQVFAGDPGAAAFLVTFSTIQNSDGSVTQTAGMGSIPNQDFVSSTLDHMSLNVDTSQVPGFQSTACTFSFSPFFSETCGQGPLGLIQVDWRGNRINTTSELDENHQTIGGSMKVDEHLDSDANSANASGSYLGISFSSVENGSLSKNRDTTITITQ